MGMGGQRDGVLLAGVADMEIGEPGRAYAVFQGTELSGGLSRFHSATRVMN